MAILSDRKDRLIRGLSLYRRETWRVREMIGFVMVRWPPLLVVVAGTQRRV
jgi:hypothetical protein